MKILILSFEFPPDPGGIGTYAYQIAKNLLEFKHDVTAIVSYKYSSPHEIISFQKKEAFQIINIDSYTGRTLDILKSFKIFKNTIRDKEIDLILVAHSRVGILAWFFKKIYNIPYFIIGHGSEFLSINYCHKYLTKFMFTASNCIILNSNYTKNLLERTSIKNQNIHIIYPGADDDLYDYNKVKRVNYDKKVILSVGALSKRKGLYYVIDAINLLKDKYHNIEYRIIGRGPEKKDIESYIKKYHLEKFVKLFGFISTEKLPSYYSDTDVFVLNSTDDDHSQVEGFGIVIIEAALMKIPVIAAKNSGIEEAVEDGITGLLVDPRNVKDIAQKIEILLDDEKKAHMLGQNGYNRAIRSYTWKKSTQKIQALINIYINGSRLVN